MSSSFVRRSSCHLNVLAWRPKFGVPKAETNLLTKLKSLISLTISSRALNIFGRPTHSGDNVSTYSSEVWISVVETQNILAEGIMNLFSSSIRIPRLLPGSNTTPFLPNPSNFAKQVYSRLALDHNNRYN